MTWQRPVSGTGSSTRATCSTVLYCTVLCSTVQLHPGHLQQRARELVRGHQLVAAHTAGVGEGLFTNYLKPGDTAVQLVAGVVTGGAAELQLRLDCGTLGGQPPLLTDSVRKVDPGLQSLLKHKM